MIVRQDLLETGPVDFDAAAVERLVMAWTARGLKNAQWAAQLEASRLAEDECLLQDASACRQADDAAAEEARLARERKCPRLGKIHLHPLRRLFR